MGMDPVLLRALFRERVHHTIEVYLYPIILGKREVPPALGLQAQTIYDVWKDRGFSEDALDFEWGRKYLGLAKRTRAGGKIDIDEIDGPLTGPFTEPEMAALKRAIWERRSCRDWQERNVPDEMIEQILEAGRAAPCGCNLDVVRFVVLRKPEEMKMVWSDVPTPPGHCVIIVVCYDSRVYRVTGQDQIVPQNQMLDCGAAADHMLLMAHALGLGGVWLTRTEKTARAFKEQYGLPDYIEPVLHIAVGWPAMGSIKSQRMPLSEMMVAWDSG
jgi:nitroreductase